MWRRNGILGAFGWWALFTVSGIYAVFAFSMGGLEILARLGFSVSSPLRELPGVFILHALFGGAVLLTGPVQFHKGLRAKRRQVHRMLGRVYAVSVAVASLSAALLAVTFDVPWTARVAFLSLAVLWFVSTALAVARARNGQIPQHREWMLRSFALSFFFVTFSLWVPGLRGTSLPEEVAYPLGVLLAWVLNLAAAEMWIRRTRPRQGHATHRPARSSRYVISREGNVSATGGARPESVITVSSTRASAGT